MLRSPGDIQDGQATAGTGRAALWGWLGFGDIRVFECVAYVPAAAVINKTAKDAINLPHGNALIKTYVHNLLLGSNYMA